MFKRDQKDNIQVNSAETEAVFQPVRNVLVYLIWIPVSRCWFLISE